MGEPIACVVGIDPGLSGGLACLSLDGVTIAVTPMPTLDGRRRTVDGAALARWLRMCPPVRLVVAEEPGQRPLSGTDADADARGQSRGPRSSGSFFRELGRIEGVLDALGLPLQLIAPRKWQDSILGPLPASAKGHDARRKLRKAQSVAYATRRFPSAQLVLPRCRKPHDGLADALGIAEYARRLIAEGRASA